MFTWDPQKAILNLSKHGVAFEEAATIFANPDALEWADEAHSGSEQRHKRLGMSIQNRVLIVVFTIRRLGNAKEAIRIISARQASRKERKAYAGRPY
jgi:uncharacterized DUF497 family protein